MAHISKFAYSINGLNPSVLNVTSNNNSNIISCALKRADGVIVVCVFNTSSHISENIDIVIDGKYINYEIKPESVVTFVTNTNSCSSYVSHSISHVDIIEKSNNTFNYIVESDIVPSETTKVFVSFYDKISNNISPIDYEYKDGKYSFTYEITSDFYYIHIIDGDKKAVMPVTKPQMIPSIKIEGTTKVITYNFINGTSWSSFCDQNGKSVYKSKNQVFDVNATLVKESINMLGVDSTIDCNPNSDEPYYYVVISSKNGKVRFVSVPLITIEEVYSNIVLKLILIDNKPHLQVNGIFLKDDSVKLKLSFVDNKHGILYELTSQKINGNKDESYEALLDISDVLNISSSKEVWYDIKLESSYGASYELNINTVNMDNTILCDDIIYEFKEWNKTIKLSYCYND